MDQLSEDTESSFAGKWRGWLALALPVVLAVDFFRILYIEWESNEQYAYGYLIPLVWLWFLWRRLEVSPASAPGSAGVAKVLLLFVCIFIPLHILWVAHPDWRLLFWLYGLGMVSLMAALSYLCGGWALSKHMLPGIVVLLFGIPWPSGMEKALVSQMMSLVTSTVTGFLPFCGIPAQQVGNLIYLDGGFVGVEEACSGIRSFQLAVVAAYILGELEWMSWFRRLVLLVLGLLLAFGINLCRSFALVLLFNEGGAELMDQWHDRIGMITMIAVVVILYLFAEILAKPVVQSSRSVIRVLQAIPPSLSLILIGIFALSPVLAEFYYDFHERESQPSPALSVAFDAMPEEAEAILIPDATSALLRYSRATAFNVPAEHAEQITYYQFHWDKGRISSFAGVHRPEICLPSAGIELVQTYPDLRTVSQHGLEMAFKAYQFQGMGNTLYVYFMVRDNRKGQQIPPALSARDRIRQAIRGERILSRELIELLVVNSPDEATAWQSAKALLEPHLTVADGE